MQTASWYSSIKDDENKKRETWYESLPSGYAESQELEGEMFFHTATFSDLPTGKTSWSVVPTWWSAIPSDFLEFEDELGTAETSAWSAAVEAAESRAGATGWRDASTSVGSGTTTTSTITATSTGTGSAPPQQTGGAADVVLLDLESSTSFLGVVVALGLAVVVGL